jgi:hypothetical protein
LLGSGDVAGVARFDAHREDAGFKELATRFAVREDTSGLGAERVKGEVVFDTDASAGIITIIGAVGFSELEWGHNE